MAKQSNVMTKDMAVRFSRAINRSDKVHYGDFVSPEMLLGLTPIKKAFDIVDYDIYAIQFGDMTILAWEILNIDIEVRFVCW